MIVISKQPLTKAYSLKASNHTQIMLKVKEKQANVLALISGSLIIYQAASLTITVRKNSMLRLFNLYLSLRRRSEKFMINGTPRFSKNGSA